MCRDGMGVTVTPPEDTLSPTVTGQGDRVSATARVPSTGEPPQA